MPCSGAHWRVQWVAVALSLGQRLLTLRECIEAAVGGFQAMMIAMVILVLAWSLGSVTEVIGTSLFLQTILSDRIAVQLIPVIVFGTSGAMAFATGTSWGTMAIMLPVAIPLVVGLGGAAVLPGGPQEAILLGSIGSVLAGAIWGDHCSPISDTTVLSSTASACDHVDHVKTQLPYALAGRVAFYATRQHRNGVRFAAGCGADDRGSDPRRATVDDRDTGGEH